MFFGEGKVFWMGLGETRGREKAPDGKTPTDGLGSAHVDWGAGAGIPIKTGVQREEKAT
jgi:hypothetical protein